MNVYAKNTPHCSDNMIFDESITLVTSSGARFPSGVIFIEPSIDYSSVSISLKCIPDETLAVLKNFYAETLACSYNADRLAEYVEELQVAEYVEELQTLMDEIRFEIRFERLEFIRWLRRCLSFLRSTVKFFLRSNESWWGPGKYWLCNLPFA